MATLPYRKLLTTRQQILDRRMTAEQIHCADQALIRQRDLARLDHPDLRPQTLEEPSADLLIRNTKRLAVKAAVAPFKVGMQLEFAADHLRAAAELAARPYAHLSTAELKRLPAGRGEPWRSAALTDEQISGLRSTRTWIDLLVNVAPTDIALELLRASDWIARAEVEAATSRLQIAAEVEPGN